MLYSIQTMIKSSNTLTLWVMQ